MVNAFQDAESINKYFLTPAMGLGRLGLKACFCVVAWWSVTCPSHSGELTVLPPQIILNADYPARLVVLERLDNGIHIDRSRDPNLRIELGDKRIASIGLLSREVSALAAGETTLEVEFGELRATVPARVTGAQHSPPSFPREVSSVLGKTGCNLGTCHGNLHGKGTFRLSLRGDDPKLDFDAISRGSAGRRIDRFAPDESLLLKKPTGAVAHQGGARFDTQSREYAILREWIENQCAWDSTATKNSPDKSDGGSNEVKLIAIASHPRRVVLAKSCRQQQLVVTAEFSDGSIMDVTRWSRFEPSAVTGVRVDDSGLVTADGPIDVSISVAYLQGRAASRATFLAHDSNPTWMDGPAASRIDELISNQLKQMQIQPAQQADDCVFVRRVYLVTVGRLPTAAEAQEFLASASQDKRERLVDYLLSQPEYALLWAMRWSDLLRNEQKVMSAKGAAQWHQWLADQIEADRPVTEMVAELIVSTGSTYDNPPASFHRTHREPETAAETVGQVFLGARLQCARCHNHPFDSWRQDDYYGLAAYFSTVERKQVDNAPRDKFDKHIISGDEVISLAKRAPEIWHPGRAEIVLPKPLGAKTRLASTSAVDALKDSSLADLARWLTTGNRQFARNMANRIWYHVLGRGIVDPPDDFRDSNPASNPELLEYLTEELIRGNYSTRHLSKLILCSRTFARQSAAEVPSSGSIPGVPVFASYPLRRMPAEAFLDAICDVTGLPLEPLQSERSSVPIAGRAMANPEVPTRAGFLTAFGKPGRLLACECERSSEVSLGQSLLLANGLEIRDKLAQPGNRIAQLLSAQVPIDEMIDELYLTSLARYPTDAEMQSMRQYVERSGAEMRESLEDVLWALVNSKEFALIR